MKKSKTILVSFVGLLIAMMAITVDILDEDRIIPVEQLPLAAKTYVHNNFPGGTIAYAKLKDEIISKKFEVGLNNGFELEFNSDGLLTDFDD